MLTKFWESAGSGLAGQWLQYVLGPAFLFWGGGFIVVISRLGFGSVWKWITSQDVATQVAILLTCFLVIVLSSKLMEQLRFGFLRLLEGYWTWPLIYLNNPFTQRQQRIIARDRSNWNSLMEKLETGTLTPVEKRKLAQLESSGHYAPANDEDCMPTLLGNILQSAESTPRHKYGLDSVICWPRLWLLLSKEAREVLSSVRQSLDTFVELWAWGLLFLIWSIWWPWAVVISILWMGLAYLLAVQSAKTYADLLESTFDLYRWNLYESVHWDLPGASSEEEIAYGKRLTEFLWRGTTAAPVLYKSKA